MDPGPMQLQPSPMDLVGSTSRGEDRNSMEPDPCGQSIILQVVALHYCYPNVFYLKVIFLLGKDCTKN